MKKQLISYGKLLGFNLITTTIFSIIITIFLLFIPIPSTIYTIALNTVSLLICVLCAIYFYKIIPSKRLIHSIIFSLLYIVLLAIISSSSLSLFSVIIRPIVFITTILILQRLSR